jgi:NAD(P)-dependent dehydrogenase (short-subunit alcohol dehydrogenase family)
MSQALLISIASTKRLKSEKGQLDIVIANAGIVESKSLADCSTDHYDSTFNINAKGVFLTVQKALPLLKNGAAIILISSVASLKGIPGYGAYSATKAAIRSFARTWTSELIGTGIRVNVLSPGPIDTLIVDDRTITREQADHLRSQFSTMIPLARMGAVDEVAAAALFHCFSLRLKAAS